VINAVMAALKKQWPAAELTIVKQGEWTYDPAFPMKKINAARRPIARNPSIVAGAEAVLSIGAPIAPITIIHTKRIGKPGYEPIDGWHRALAADHQGLKKIPAYVGEGSDEWTKAMIAFDDDIPTPPDSANDEEPADDTEGKAQTSFRRDLEGRVTPRLQHDVAGVLADQKRSIAARVRSMYDAIKANPRDTTIWWPKGSWDTRLADALKPTLTDVAESVRTHVTTTFKPVSTTKASVLPRAVEHVLTRGAARVTGINETTRDGIKDLVVKGIEDSLTPVELGDAVAAWSGFDEYRAEMIARTELMDAYNAAALGSYGEIGVEMVQAIDGDGDPECAERDGQTFSLDDASAIEDHPNGTLDWVPADTEPKAIIVTPLKAKEAMRGSTRKAAESLAEMLREDAEQDARMGYLMKALADQKAQPIVVDTEPFAKALLGLSSQIAAMPAPVVNVAAPIIQPPRLTRKIVDRDKKTGDIIGVYEEEIN
jgi:uncharacterized ParB-like nuclease family protein